MPQIDPAVAEFLRFLAGSAIVAAIVSGAVADWRSRQAEKRAAKREQDAEARAVERERARERRDRWLAQINDTQGDYLGSMDWLLYRAMGAQERADRARWGNEHWPEAQWYLIGDEDLLRQVFDFRRDLMARPAGKFSQGDALRAGALQGHVLARLEAQRERVRNAQEPAWPSATFVRQYLEETSEAHGIPPELMPKIRDDIP